MRSLIRATDNLPLCLCLLHREVHPEGLPHAYTVILMFRLLPDSPSEAFDIWQVSNKDHQPETGITIDRKWPTPLVCVGDGAGT